MALTREQTLAIDMREENLLVSAGAGSGKTFVMVERIKKLITEEQVSVDDILVVTFTNASAAEMKERIGRAITKSMAEIPEQSGFLQEQLIGLKEAHISTFHAFAQRVIKKFYYLIGIEPSLKVCDETQAVLLLEQVIDDIIEEWLGDDHREEMTIFLNCYSDERSFQQLKQNLIKGYNNLRTMPDPIGWLQQQQMEIASFSERWREHPAMRWLLEYVKEQLREACYYMQLAYDITVESGVTSIALKLEDEVNGCCDLADENIESLEEIEELLNEMPQNARLVSNKAEKEIWATIKDQVGEYRKKSVEIIKNIKSQFFAATLAEQIEEEQANLPKVETLVKLLQAIDQQYFAAKQELGVMDFGDMEHLAIAILKHEEASQYYKNKFKHIFVDEFQDTNPVQEELIQLIRRDNNTFLVGDIKQCIYQFRLADPSIFQRRQNSYRQVDSNEVEIGAADERLQQDNGVVINLNANFRSKAPIIDFVNGIFDGPMKEFDENAKLIPFSTCPEQCAHVPVILDVDKSSIDQIVEDAALEGADDEYLDELVTVEKEAMATAKLIKSIIGQPISVGEGEEQIVRPIDYRDIVILMRSIKASGSVYGTVFKKAGIPMFVQEEEGYFNAYEVAIMIDLLSYLDNNRRDKELISVLHSPLFDFSSEQLAQIRIMHKESSFYKAFMHCVDIYQEILNSEDPTAIASDYSRSQMQLIIRVGKAHDDLKKWRAKAKVQRLDQVIWDIMVESGYYLAIGAMPLGIQRQGNLRMLLEFAGTFQTNQRGGLFEFVTYIKALTEKKIDRGPASLIGEGDNVVRLMTIHKSKGLEFPVVILSGMQKALQYSRNDSFFTIEKNIGLGLMHSGGLDYWKRRSLIQRIAVAKKRRDEEAENWRVLYVAMTRAKDRLYMMNLVYNQDKHKQALELGLYDEKSFNNMLIASPVRRVDFVLEPEDLVGAIGPSGKPMTFEEAICKGVWRDEADESLKTAILERLNFSYENQESTSRRFKYTVSQLNKARPLSEKDNYEVREALSYVPKFLRGDQQLTAAEKGTVFHRFMYLLDFQQIKDGNNCKVQLDSFVEKGLMTAAEAKEINCKQADNFFKTKVGQEILTSKAGKLLKEQPFTVAMKLDGDQVLVQGIIDGCLVDGEKVILWDYKTNFIDSSKTMEELADYFGNMYMAQMGIYAKALEAALHLKVEKAYLYMTKLGKLLEIDLTKPQTWKII